MSHKFHTLLALQTNPATISWVITFLKVWPKIQIKEQLIAKTNIITHLIRECQGQKHMGNLDKLQDLLETVGNIWWCIRMYDPSKESMLLKFVKSTITNEHIIHCIQECTLATVILQLILDSENLKLAPRQDLSIFRPWTKERKF